MRLTDRADRYSDGLAYHPPITDLAHRVEAELRRSAYLVLTTIVCEERDGTLVLRGRLPSYYLKQMAGAIVEGVEGVRRVDNQIEIDSTANLPARSAAAPEGGRRG
jgi:osmotically-inducible protein OsmY